MSDVSSTDWNVGTQFCKLRNVHVTCVIHTSPEAHVLFSCRATFVAAPSFGLGRFHDHERGFVLLIAPLERRDNDQIDDEGVRSSQPCTSRKSTQQCDAIITMLPACRTAPGIAVSDTPPHALRVSTRDTLYVADPGVIVTFFRHFSPPQSQRSCLFFARNLTFTPLCCRFCTPTALVFSGTSTFPTRPTRKCGRRVSLLACRRRTNPRSRAAKISA